MRTRAIRRQAARRLANSMMRGRRPSLWIWIKAWFAEVRFIGK